MKLFVLWLSPSGLCSAWWMRGAVQSAARVTSVLIPTAVAGRYKKHRHNLCAISDRCKDPALDGRWENGVRYLVRSRAILTGTAYWLLSIRLQCSCAVAPGVTGKFDVAQVRSLYKRAHFRYNYVYMWRRCSNARRLPEEAVAVGSLT